MKYEKPGVGGAWAKANDVVSGTQVKIITEALPVQGQFGTQTVAKARFKGAAEAVNININKPTISGLIEAFGDDSKDWIGHLLTAQTEKAIVGGKRVTIMYLIPEGFELKEDEGGYMTVQKIGKIEPPEVVKKQTPPANDDGLNPDDVPF